MYLIVTDINFNVEIAVVLAILVSRDVEFNVAM